MDKPHETKDSLKALARLAGLELLDERLEELLPLMRDAAEARVLMDRLDLGEAGLPLIFSPVEE